MRNSVSASDRADPVGAAAMALRRLRARFRLFTGPDVRTGPPGVCARSGAARGRALERAGSPLQRVGAEAQGRAGARARQRKLCDWRGRVGPPRGAGGGPRPGRAATDARTRRTRPRPRAQRRRGPVSAVCADAGGAVSAATRPQGGCDRFEKAEEGSRLRKKTSASMNSFLAMRLRARTQIAVGCVGFICRARTRP